jgi:hypothetical protein
MMAGYSGANMEPTPLTCPKCGASWKLVKAGKGAVRCPKCKAGLDGSPARQPAPPPAAPMPGSPPPSEVSDVDDPGLRGGFASALPAPTPPVRRATNPFVRVLVILLLLVILVPLAALVLFTVVCAMLIA